MSRKTSRTLARCTVVVLVTYAVCCFWVAAPVLGVILSLPVRADMAVGVVSGILLTRR